MQKSEIKALQNGSIELVVLGLLAALIVVLAIPLFAAAPDRSQNSQSHKQSEQQFDQVHPIASDYH